MPTVPSLKVEPPLRAICPSALVPQPILASSGPVLAGDAAGEAYTFASGVGIA